jgi:glycosyltransferase involved in cell wall biosynthesis
MSRPIRVAHLVAHPVQYFAPLYRELASRQEIRLTVYYYSDATGASFYDAGFGRRLAWDTDLLEGYRWRVMPSARRMGSRTPFSRRPNLDLIAELVARPYDVVWAHGYTHPTTWLAFLATRAGGGAFMIREEQTLLHPRRLHRRLAKRIALRALLARSWGLYIGEQNRRYFLHHGVAAERLLPARYCVDNRFFQTSARSLAPRRGEVRAALGVGDDAPVVLFCGKLIPKKQPLRLIEAFARVRAGQPCHLLMAGDGPLRREAEALIRRLRIPDVHLAGFVNQTQLPALYAAADCLVLPSMLHETWGLVVNEAMNFSLPVVVSDKVGCGADLVRPGWNGFVVAHDRTEELVSAIATLVRDAGLRRRFGARSLALVAEYSIERCADQLVAACIAAASRGRTDDPTMARSR